MLTYGRANENLGCQPLRRPAHDARAGRAAPFAEEYACGGESLPPGMSPKSA
jgi:hypothetical protein